jgi:hypothetical protein
MAKVFLTRNAQNTLEEFVTEGSLQGVALVVCPDPRTDVLLMKFIEKPALNLLKTRLICEILPGLEVHTFGLSRLPEDTVLEIGLIPLRNYCVVQEKTDQTKIIINTLFRVQLHPIHTGVNQSISRLSVPA